MKPTDDDDMDEEENGTLDGRQKPASLKGFTIPKKRQKLEEPGSSTNRPPAAPASTDDKIRLRFVDRGSEEYKKFVGRLSFSDERLRSAVRINNLKIISNVELEKKFNTFKRKVRGVLKQPDIESICYLLVFDKDRVKEIIEKGIQTGTSFFSDLGNTNYGVYLYDNVDLISPAPFLGNTPITVIAFKVLKGRPNKVGLDSYRLEPPKAFVASVPHMGLRNQKEPIRWRLRKFQLNQVFVYQVDDATYRPQTFPAGVLPFATFEVMPIFDEKKANMGFLRPELPNRIIFEWTMTEGILANHSCELHAVIEEQPKPFLVLDNLKFPFYVKMNDVYKQPAVKELFKEENWGRLLDEEEVLIHDIVDGVVTEIRFFAAAFFLKSSDSNFPKIVKELRASRLCLLGRGFSGGCIIGIPPSEFSLRLGLPLTRDACLFVLIIKECSVFDSNTDFLIARITEKMKEVKQGCGQENKVIANPPKMNEKYRHGNIKHAATGRPVPKTIREKELEAEEARAKEAMQQQARMQNGGMQSRSPTESSPHSPYNDPNHVEFPRNAPSTPDEEDDSPPDYTKIKIEIISKQPDRPLKGLLKGPKKLTRFPQTLGKTYQRRLMFADDVGKPLEETSDGTLTVRAGGEKFHREDIKRRDYGMEQGMRGRLIHVPDLNNKAYTNKVFQESMGFLEGFSSNQNVPTLAPFQAPQTPRPSNSMYRPGEDRSHGSFDERRSTNVQYDRNRYDNMGPPINNNNINNNSGYGSRYPPLPVVNQRYGGRQTSMPSSSSEYRPESPKPYTPQSPTYQPESEMMEVAENHPANSELVDMEVDENSTEGSQDTSREDEEFVDPNDIDYDKVLFGNAPPPCEENHSVEDIEFEEDEQEQEIEPVPAPVNEPRKEPADVNDLMSILFKNVKTKNEAEPVREKEELPPPASPDASPTKEAPAISNSDMQNIRRIVLNCQRAPGSSDVDLRGTDKDMRLIPTVAPFSVGKGPLAKTQCAAFADDHSPSPEPNRDKDKNDKGRSDRYRDKDYSERDDRDRHRRHREDDDYRRRRDDDRRSRDRDDRRERDRDRDRDRDDRDYRSRRHRDDKDRDRDDRSNGHGRHSRDGGSEKKKSKAKETKPVVVPEIASIPLPSSKEPQQPVRDVPSPVPPPAKNILEQIGISKSVLDALAQRSSTTSTNSRSSSPDAPASPDQDIRGLAQPSKQIPVESSNGSRRNSIEEGEISDRKSPLATLSISPPIPRSEYGSISRGMAPPIGGGGVVQYPMAMTSPPPTMAMGMPPMTVPPPAVGMPITMHAMGMMQQPAYGWGAPAPGRYPTPGGAYGGPFMHPQQMMPPGTYPQVRFIPYNGPVGFAPSAPNLQPVTVDHLTVVPDPLIFNLPIISNGNLIRCILGKLEQVKIQHNLPCEFLVHDFNYQKIKYKSENASLLSERDMNRECLRMLDEFKAKNILIVMKEHETCKDGKRDINMIGKCIFALADSTRQLHRNPKMIFITNMNATNCIHNGMTYDQKGIRVGSLNQLASHDTNLLYV